MSEPTEPEPHSTPRQVILGLFILGQLVFLAAQNTLGFIEECRGWLSPETSKIAGRIAPDWPEKSGHVWDHASLLSKRLRFWAQLTGQDQAWSLFAPSVGKTTGFPAVLLRWDDDATPAVFAQLLAAGDPWQAAALLQVVPLLEAELVLPDFARIAEQAESKPGLPPLSAVLLLSDNEPLDRHDFVRTGLFRLRRLESRLALSLIAPEDQQPEERFEDWSKSITEHVQEYGGLMHGYLRWRLAVWQARNPGSPPPRQVILLDRAFRIRTLDPEDVPLEGSPWIGPYTLPLARWQLHAVWDDEHGPLERYDLVQQRFLPARK